MKPRPKHRYLLAAAIAGTLIASSCSTNESITAQNYESPIAEFFEINTEGFSDDDFLEQERKVEESVAACMKEEGFDYTPREINESEFFSEDDFDPEDTEALREETAKWGFYISTQAFSQDSVGPDLVGYEVYEAEGPEGPEGPKDPNQDYLNTLSDSERLAWENALWGRYEINDADLEGLSEQEIDELWETESSKPENQGCYDKAWEAIYEDGFDSGEGVYEILDKEFGEELQSIYEDVLKDERIVAAEKKVADCVAEKGYTYLGDTEEGWIQLQELFEKPLEEISVYHGRFDEEFPEGDFPEEAMEDFPEGEFPEDAMEDEFPEGDFSEDQGDFSEEELADIEEAFEEARAEGFPPEEVELTEADKAILADVQKDEVEMALAVFDCGGGTGTQGDLFFEVYTEYEQDFIEANRERLTEIKEEAAAK